MSNSQNPPPSCAETSPKQPIDPRTGRQGSHTIVEKG